MKKLTALLIALMLVVTAFSSCGGNENTDVNEDTNEPAASTEETKAPENNSTSSDKIVNDDGEEFIVDTSVKGTVKEGAASINDSKIVLCGKEYAFPIKISDLIADGWSFPEEVEFEEDFQPEVDTQVPNLVMYNSEGKEIGISALYNESSEAVSIEDCLISEIEFDCDIDDSADFVFPGGIVAESTAADVLSVFGNPNSASGFEYGWNSDDNLKYDNNDISAVSFQFVFNEDGTLYSCSMARHFTDL